MSPSIRTCPERSASPSSRPCQSSCGQRFGVGLDGRVGSLGEAAIELELAVAHAGMEALVAEPQLERRVEAGRRAGVEERPHGEDVGVDAHARLSRQCRRACAPAAERRDDRLELLAPLGQLVDARAGRRGKLAPPHDSRPLELAQALSEDVGAGVDDARAKIREALGAEQQLADDQQRPALADEIEGMRRRARFAVGTRACGGHTPILPRIVLSHTQLIVFWD